MNDSKQNSQIEIGSEKNFGIVFSIFFAILFFYSLVDNDSPNVVALLLATIFILLAFIAPSIFKYPNIIWNTFGILIGKLVTPIFMMVIFLVIIIPFAVAFKIIGRDIMNIKFKKKNSYWIIRKDKPQSMKLQF